MVRRRRKKREDVYSTNYERLSTYPSFRQAAVKSGPDKPGLRPGAVIRIRVSGVDDDGRPVGQYMGYRIVVEEADVDPGVELKVRIESVTGRTAYGKRVE